MTADSRPVRSGSVLVGALRRPYPVTMPMVALMALVPFYIFIAGFNRDRPQHFPETALDRVLPLQPGWALVYGALYLFLILAPVMVIREETLIRRTFQTYLAVWLIAYGFFLAYPTTAPRPTDLSGDGFLVWALRVLYDADPPRNCFPSLHVAHSFVSALACYRVHRGVGIAAGVAALLVGVSTLFTKQHYVLDVVAGIVLAFGAYALFLRRSSRELLEPDRRTAPTVALWTLVASVTGIAWSWMFYYVMNVRV